MGHQGNNKKNTENTVAVIVVTVVLVEREKAEEMIERSTKNLGIKKMLKIKRTARIVIESVIGQILRLLSNQTLQIKYHKNRKMAGKMVHNKAR